MPRLIQINRQPCDVEVETVVVAEPLNPERPHAARADQLLPGNAAFGMSAHPGYQVEFSLIDSPVIARIVPIPIEKDNSPEDTHCSEEKEDLPPVQMSVQGGDQRWSDR